MWTDGLEVTTKIESLSSWLGNIQDSYETIRNQIISQKKNKKIINDELDSLVGGQKIIKIVGRKFIKMKRNNF